VSAKGLRAPLGATPSICLVRAGPLKGQALVGYAAAELAPVVVRLPEILVGSVALDVGSGVRSTPRASKTGTSGRSCGSRTRGAAMRHRRFEAGLHDPDMSSPILRGRQIHPPNDADDPSASKISGPC
jgi:hypothetical protein